MSTRVDWRDVARMPWDMFIGSVDWLCRTAMPPGAYERRYQDDFSGNSSDTGVSGRNDSYTSTFSANGATSNRGWGEPVDQPSGNIDQVLRSDDIKLLNYKVVFTKRGKEKVLASGEELVTYKTNHTTYSALKIARFLERSGESIPEEDRHFIQVHVDVIKRYAREREDLEQQRVDLLEREVEILSSIEREVVSGNHRRAA